jgi:hypothetical protein
VSSFLSGDVRIVPRGGINVVDARDVAAIQARGAQSPVTVPDLRNRSS